jgi:NAD(P)-dependent dehydrogenase (short-subunit alcohol dehydrogenase family)
VILPFQVDLQDRVAVVTGGGGVLGAVLAEALARCGARVAILDHDTAAAAKVAADLQAQGLRAYAVVADVLDPASLQAAATRTQAELGPCDLLINGAGGNHPAGTTSHDRLSAAELGDPSVRSFFELDLGSTEEVVRLNFLGSWLPTQVFARQMLGRSGCSVINIASLSAFTPLTRVAAYSAAKAAVANFTRWLAVHLSPLGIRVNALAPGFFVTRQNRELLIDAQTGAPTERAQRILAHTPMGRFGEPRELIGTLLWLSCEPASGFVSGLVVPVDGGFLAYAGV